MHSPRNEAVARVRGRAGEERGTRYFMEAQCVSLSALRAPSSCVIRVSAVCARKTRAAQRFARASGRVLLRTRAGRQATGAPRRVGSASQHRSIAVSRTRQAHQPRAGAKYAPALRSGVRAAGGHTGRRLQRARSFRRHKRPEIPRLLCESFWAHAGGGAAAEQARGEHCWREELEHLRATRRREREGETQHDARGKGCEEGRDLDVSVLGY
jgi:hypothetical protein